jgi:hypothetical protein
MNLLLYIPNILNPVVKGFAQKTLGSGALGACKASSCWWCGDLCVRTTRFQWILVSANAPKAGIQTCCHLALGEQKTDGGSVPWTNRLEHRSSDLTQVMLQWGNELAMSSRPDKIGQGSLALLSLHGTWLRMKATGSTGFYRTRSFGKRVFRSAWTALSTCKMS